MPVTAEFPEYLQCLFQPKRYKILYGGRGAGRSWGAARALLLIGAEKQIRVLCARELQNSIAESVHKLLSDQIDSLGLRGFYEIQVGKIIGANGTTFSFEGIKNNTTKIKSYEGIDYCWLEEANKVSRASWGVLIPTIRKENSEIWITFNPELETDYTYCRFVKDPPLRQATGMVKGVLEDDLSYVCRMTWANNPWFPEVLRTEMENDRKRDFDYYLNVWEGHCLQNLEGAVYAKELRRAQEEGRICSVDWDHESPVDTFWDLGRRDATAIWFAQRVAMEYRIIGYFEDTGHEINYYLQELQARKYLYGQHYLPHDARAKRLGSKRTIEEIIRTAYPGNVRIVPKLSVADGINAARTIFSNCWFDEDECADGLAALRHYRYKVVDGQLSNEPMHNDGADAFRYLAVALRGPRDDSVQRGMANKMGSALKRLGDIGSSGLGWMG